MHRGKGQNKFIYSGSSGQYALETYIVMSLYGGISIGMLLLTEAMKSSGNLNGQCKKITARVSSCTILLLFSLLLSIFRQKSYGYPYSLLF